MKNKEDFTKEEITALERFNTFLNRRIPVISSYLLLMLILKEGFAIPFPFITFFLVSLMMLSSLALAFFFDQFSLRDKTISNLYFLFVLFDLFLLTLATVYYLGGVTWFSFIFYSFYLVLIFMTLQRYQAIFATFWIIFLYLSVIFLQSFRIIPFQSLFDLRTQTASDFSYVLTSTVAYISTFILVAYYSQGFYQLYEAKIKELRETSYNLEREKGSLEDKVKERKEELEKERKGLAEKVEERKKELEKEEILLRERAEELEKFQKIALGREEKLKELERELEKIKKSKF